MARWALQANVYALIQCERELEDGMGQVAVALEELGTMEEWLKKFTGQLEVCITERAALWRPAAALTVAGASSV